MSPLSFRVLKDQCEILSKFRQISLHNKLDNYLKEIINKSVIICKTYILSLVFDINILIVQYACMFLLTNALKEFNNSQESKSKTTAK